MMDAMVVVMIAVVVMLLAGVAVGVSRLVTALRHLRTGVDGARETVQPLLTELAEGAGIARIEADAVRSSIAVLRDGSRRVRS